MTKTIQVFKPFFRTDEVLDSIRDCLEKGWTGIGYKTEEFEEKWKEYSGLKNCHFLNSATSGLHLAVRIFKHEHGWQDGDEIITTALTFVSTNHAILYENLTPVFADVDKSLCLDPNSVEKMITKKTKAVIYVGIGGNAGNYRAIADVCSKNNLVLILDAAHMSGTKWKDTGKHVGQEADCAVFSFQAVKNCPSADAGAICFKDDRLDRTARKLSWLGIDKSTFDRYSEQSYKWRYDVSDVGYKYHGNSVIAAICLVSLKYLDEDNKKRREIAKKYNDFIKPASAMEIITHADDIVSSRHLFQIATDSRDSLIENLARKSIFCGVHYIENTRYKIYDSFKSDLSTTKYYSEKLISLPLHLHLDESDLEHIISNLNIHE
jgi:dTDP-4-amino-4,6-dideoxygalactose transaminase